MSENEFAFFFLNSMIWRHIRYLPKHQH